LGSTDRLQHIEAHGPRPAPGLFESSEAFRLDWLRIKCTLCDSCIYELEGDTYKVCMALEGHPRPTEFVTRPGNGHVFEILKREKP